jgi:uncharacterized membrane protein YidH (DUF202 family)
MAVVLTLIGVLSQIATVAAPLWKVGDASAALRNTGIELIIAVPALFYAAGMWRARRVFARVGMGEILTPENSRGVADVGLCLLAGALWSLLLSDGFEPLRAARLPEYLGQIGTAAQDLALAALGLAIVMLGRVWAMAARIKADNDSIL